MFNYKTPPGFDSRPTEEEIALTASILNGELKGERHGCLPMIRESAGKKYPEADPEVISRVTYLALAVIDDREIRAAGWRKITASELEARGRAGKKLTYRSAGVFGVREIVLRPKEAAGRIYWMLPRARRRAVSDHSILTGYVKGADLA